MHSKYEVSISYGSKVIAKVKVDNRQTNKQPDRQEKNNISPINRSGGIKIKDSLHCVPIYLCVTHILLSLLAWQMCWEHTLSERITDVSVGTSKQCLSALYLFSPSLGWLCINWYQNLHNHGNIYLNLHQSLHNHRKLCLNVHQNLNNHETITISIAREYCISMKSKLYQKFVCLWSFPIYTQEKRNNNIGNINIESMLNIPNHKGP